MIELRLKQPSLSALSSLEQLVAINIQNVVTSLVVITWTDDAREEVLISDEDQPCSFNQRRVVEQNFSRITASASSCGCDVASGSSLASLQMDGHVSDSSHLAKLPFTVNRPRIPFGWRFMGQDVTIWSAVCFSAPHSQDAVEGLLHLCIVNRKRPTPVWGRFSPT